MDTLLHLFEKDTAKISALIRTAKNLMADETVDVDNIAAVINSGAVNYALEENKASEYLSEIANQGVDIKICGNSVESQDIEKEDLIDGSEVVSSGIAELTRLQDEGYGYVRI